MKTRSSKNASDTPASMATAAAPKVAKKKNLKRDHSPEKPTAGAKVVKKAKKTSENVEILVAPPPAPVSSESAKYEGNFDFFFNGASGADFQKRFDLLREKQVAGQRPNGLCYFGAAPTYSDSSFETAAFLHPMEESPFKLSLHSITANASDGISAHVGLLADDCGIASLDGSFKMKRVWAKPDDASIELFEGEAHVKIVHGSMYSSRGHGRGTSRQLPFTAIRKKNAEGEEVGLGPRKCESGSHSHGGGGGHGGGGFGRFYHDLDSDSDDYGGGHGRGAYGGLYDGLDSDDDGFESDGY